MEGAVHQGKAVRLARAQGRGSDCICGQEADRDDYWCPVSSSSLTLEPHPSNIHRVLPSSFTRTILTNTSEACVIGYSKSLEGHNQD